MEDAEDKHGELSAAGDAEMDLVVMLITSSGVTLPFPGGTGVPLHARDSETGLIVMLVTSSWCHLAVSWWHRCATAC